MKKHGGFGRVAWLCAGLLASAAGHATDAADPDIDRGFVLSGFGTLGLARSDSDDAEYVRDLSQPRGLTKRWSAKIDSVLGLQGNLKLDPQTEAVVQIISRYRHDGSHNPEVSWAFLRHDFAPDFQARIGRLGTEFYMLADSRLIGYANTTVRPPPDFYGPLVFSHFDGIDATASTRLGPGLLRAKLYGGRSPEFSPVPPSATWDMRGARLAGGYLDYLSGPWQLRLGHGTARFADNELPLDLLIAPLFAPLPAPDITALYPELSTRRKTARFDSLGSVYDRGPLRVQAMLGRITHESAAYEDSRAGFVIASCRMGRFTPYLGYAQTRSKPVGIATTITPALDALAGSLPRGTHSDQHTITLGTRWDFQPNRALKVQLDLVRGQPDSVFLFRGPDVRRNGRMNVLGTTLDFVF